MKLSRKEKRQLKNLIKQIDQKSYVGIMIVHYGEISRDEQGFLHHSLFVDSLRNQTVKNNVPCQLGVLKLFK